MCFISAKYYKNFILIYNYKVKKVKYRAMCFITAKYYYFIYSKESKNRNGSKTVLGD